MSLLRLLPVSAFASICVVSAAAQSPAAPSPTPPATTFSSPQFILPKTFTFVAPKPFITAPQLSVPQAAPAPLSDLEKAKAGLEKMEAALAAGKAKPLTASNDGCFTMRSYGFTPGDLHSAPRPTTSTTCTPAHTVILKDATATPTK